MKGAIGNAFLLNIVITFVITFLSLLIGSMAYTKAYKVKNHIVNSIDQFVSEYGPDVDRASQHRLWTDIVNPYLGKVGYQLSTKNTCDSVDSNGFVRIRGNNIDYDYCLYHQQYPKDKYTLTQYRVVVFMKLDLPIIGDYIRIPVRGETKEYISYEEN
ncbi:MAG: hypothetical protein J6D28_03380 [Bacilli bacterium]|nr:hypothetical protein [Bacilli bacterium]